ncbi:MAG: hypothetical protein ACFCD0_13135 [Gemmataceae bacterium]
MRRHWARQFSKRLKWRQVQELLEIKPGRYRVPIKDYREERDVLALRLERCWKPLGLANWQRSPTELAGRRCLREIRGRIGQAASICLRLPYVCELGTNNV